MAKTLVTFLHLTDLHCGQPRYLLDPGLVLLEILKDIEQLRGRDRFRELIGPPELILFTGDLAYSGKEAEYGIVEGWLKDLCEGLQLNQNALAVVPGNHDMEWQEFSPDEKLLWSFFNNERVITVRDQFFQKAEYWLREKVSRAFRQYLGWLDVSKLPIIKPHRRGMMPGDFVSTWTSKSGVRIGLMGLNSAYLDLFRNSNVKAQGLALYEKQVFALFSPSNPAIQFQSWKQEHQICFIMTHHPPSWLSKQSLDSLKQAVAVGSNVALHLCGHLHEARTENWGHSWNQQTDIYQGRSLFGVEEDELGGPNLQTSFGYTICTLSMEAGADRATLRVYPRYINPTEKPYKMKREPIAGDDGHLEPRMPSVRPWPGHAPSRRADDTRPPGHLSKKVYIPRGTEEDLLSHILDHDAQPAYGAIVAAQKYFGKTALLDWLRNRLERQQNCQVRYLALGDESAKRITMRLCRLLLPNLKPTDTPDFGDCVTEYFGQHAQPQLLVLLLDDLDMVNVADRKLLAHVLRMTLANNRYSRGDGSSGMRIICTSSQPVRTVLPSIWSADGSDLSPYLKLFILEPLTEAGVYEHAQANGWPHTESNLRILCEFTGGHPGHFSILLDALNREPNQQAWLAPNIEPAKRLLLLRGWKAGERAYESLKQQLDYRTADGQDNPLISVLRQAK